MDIQSKLREMHQYLMYKKFPYHSVSVIHRQDMGFKVIFMGDVRDMVTEEISGYIKAFGFSISYVDPK